MTFDAKKLENVSKVLAEAVHGDRIAQGRIKAIAENKAPLSEAISTSDLAKTFNAVTRAELVRQYAAQEQVWKLFAKREVLPDFREAQFRELTFTDDVNLAENGGVATAPGSLPNVPELTEYPTFTFTTAENKIKLAKKGARIGFSWEAVINDEWGFIASLPGQLAIYARNTEETEAAKVLATATGPNADTFKTANGNAADNKKLNLDALQFAKQAVRNRKVNGAYVTVQKFALVVPTSLADTARNLLNITSLEISDKTTNRDVKYTTSTNNGDVTLVVNDWLTKIDTSANAATTWYLVPLGGTDGTRTSVVVAFLQGNENPDFRQSGNTGLYLGGGDVPSLEGSLLNDDVEYRVRHVVTGGYLYGTGMYASTGTTAYTAP